MHNTNRPYVMSIAGFDPSGGAGVLADIKVFEQHKTYGFAVITSNTIQNDSEVKSVRWIPLNEIIKQMDVLLDKFKVNVFKIGITENEEMLQAIINHILQKKPAAVIIWDPILAATSGFDFFSGEINIEQLLNGIVLVTPNLLEFEKLFVTENKAFGISYSTSVFLKGGHIKSSTAKGTDELYRNGKKITLLPGIGEISSKHGSGCVLSSAIASNIALGMNIEEACRNAKHYTEKVLSSNKSLLAYHN